MEYWWAYVLAGLVCGIFSATFGVGSGIILVPTLVLVFSLPQKSAQGTCLAAMVVIALAGAIRYWLNPDIKVDLAVAALVAAGGIGGAVIGSIVAHHVPAGHLRRLFAIIMIVAAVKMLLPARKAARQAEPPPPAASSRSEPDG